VTLIVFALTGGIASGKSAVAARFRSRGLTVVDADQLARAAVAPGSDGLKQVEAHFGARVLNDSGELDRKQLGEIVFSNAAERAILNAIVHPEVRRLAALAFAEAGARGEPLACYEVPLLFEVGMEGQFAKVVVVDAPDGVRRARLAARDTLDREQVEARIAAQMPLAVKVRRADYVIVNDSTRAELDIRADVVFEQLCDAVGVPVERFARPER